MPGPPSDSKVNPAAQPTLFISPTSQAMSRSQLDYYAENVMGIRISAVSGVARVQVSGAAKYAVRVQANPAKLAVHQIDLEQVRGSLFGFDKSYMLESNSQLVSAAQFSELVVRYRNGNPVHSERDRKGL